MRISDWSSDVCSSDLRICSCVACRLGGGRIAPPFRPGAIVKREIMLAEQVETKEQDGCGDARSAACHDGAGKIDACIGERLSQRVAALPCAVRVQQLADRKSTRLNSSH